VHLSEVADRHGLLEKGGHDALTNAVAGLLVRLVMSSTSDFRGVRRQGPVLECDERLVRSDERGRIGAQSVLSQCYDCKDAQDADQDKGALNETSGDVTEGEAFVLPLEEREQHHGAADVGDDKEQLEERTKEHAGVGARTVDVVGIAQDTSVRELSCNRGDGRASSQ
jgi:hypothetical protein